MGTRDLSGSHLLAWFIRCVLLCSASGAVQRRRVRLRCGFFPRAGRVCGMLPAFRIALLRKTGVGGKSRPSFIYPPSLQPFFCVGMNPNLKNGKQRELPQGLLHAPHAPLQDSTGSAETGFRMTVQRSPTSSRFTMLGFKSNSMFTHML